MPSTSRRLTGSAIPQPLVRARIGASLSPTKPRWPHSRPRWPVAATDADADAGAARGAAPVTGRERPDGRRLGRNDRATASALALERRAITVGATLCGWDRVGRKDGLAETAGAPGPATTAMRANGGLCTGVGMSAPATGRNSGRIDRSGALAISGWANKTASASAAYLATRLTFLSVRASPSHARNRGRPYPDLPR